MWLQIHKGYTVPNVESQVFTLEVPCKVHFFLKPQDNDNVDSLS